MAVTDSTKSNGNSWTSRMNTFMSAKMIQVVTQVALSLCQYTYLATNSKFVWPKSTDWRIDGIVRTNFWVWTWTRCTWQCGSCCWRTNNWDWCIACEFPPTWCSVPHFGRIYSWPMDFEAPPMSWAECSTIDWSSRWHACSGWSSNWNRCPSLQLLLWSSPIRLPQSTLLSFAMGCFYELILETNNWLIGLELYVRFIFIVSSLLPLLTLFPVKTCFLCGLH